jgi:hypothetical protein
MEISEASTAVATPDAVLERSAYGHQCMVGKPSREIKEQHA